MADTRTLVPRSKKVLFYGVPAASGDTTTYHRMKGFTDVSTSKNAKEYTRQYVDELFEQTDVTGYSPSTSYGFDQYAGDPVHADIVKITDDELIGSNAVIGTCSSLVSSMTSLRNPQSSARGWPGS